MSKCLSRRVHLREGLPKKLEILNDMCHKVSDPPPPPLMALFSIHFSCLKFSPESKLFSEAPSPSCIFCHPAVHQWHSHFFGHICLDSLWRKDFLLWISIDLVKAHSGAISETPGTPWGWRAASPYLGGQLTFTAPTKCDPSAGHCSGHPLPASHKNPEA